MSILLLSTTEVVKIEGKQPVLDLQDLGGYQGQYFSSDNELSGSWTQDGEEWYAEMPTPWDSLSTFYSPLMASIFPVKIYEETQISFKVKTTFGPKHTTGFTDMAGGVFVFYASDVSASSFLADESSISDLTIIGGWNDWQTLNFTLQAGEYFLFFGSAHAYIRSNMFYSDRGGIGVSGTLAYPPVPDGESATYQARVKDFVTSPGIIHCGISVSDMMIGGTSNQPIELIGESIEISDSTLTPGMGVSISLVGEGVDLLDTEVDIRGIISLEQEGIQIGDKSLGYSWALPIEKLIQAKQIYICTLTADGFDDLEIPISSFTARIRNAEQSYLGAIIPNITTYEDDINDRADGEIIISKGFLEPDGTRNLEQIIISNFDYLRLDQGGSRASGTIVGYKQTTYGSGVERTISNISYRSVTTEGKLRLRGDIDLFVRPGDVLCGDDSFVIDQINYYVSANLAYMEVAE